MPIGMCSVVIHIVQIHTAQRAEHRSAPNANRVKNGKVKQVPKNRQ